MVLAAWTASRSSSGTLTRGGVTVIVRDTADATTTAAATGEDERGEGREGYGKMGLFHGCF